MTDQPINGHGAQQQLQIPAECQPQRLPVAWVVQTNPVTAEVAIVMFDATGQRWIVMDNPDAARFAEDILRNAGLARTGLVIP